MQCVDFERSLEHQPDGPLSQTASAHMDSCDGCRLLWSDLDAIRAAGREIGADAPMPPARIWTGLRAQLAAEGLIREPRAGGWFAGWFAAPGRLALASASLSFLLAAAGLVAYRGYEAAPAAFESSDVAGVAAPAVPELHSALDGDVRSVLASLPEHDSALAASLQKNLGIVDNFIAVCEKSVREQPNNPVARDYLYGAYQQKAVLLATATDRSTMEDR